MPNTRRCHGSGDEAFGVLREREPLRGKVRKAIQTPNRVIAIGTIKLNAARAVPRVMQYLMAWVAVYAQASVQTPAATVPPYLENEKVEFTGWPFGALKS